MIEPQDFLTQWDELIPEHCFPHWRIDWFHQHLCVIRFALNHCSSLSHVKMNEPPTAHEQLEAKLALRDWLKDKATPAVAARLLASLDE